MKFGIVELYCGDSGKKGFYNSQETGLARAMKSLGYDSVIFRPCKKIKNVEEEEIENRIKVVYVPASTIGVHSRFDWSILSEYQIEVVQLESDNQVFAPDCIHYCEGKGILIYNYIGTISSNSKNRVKFFFLNLGFGRNIRAYKRHKCFSKTANVKEQLSSYGISDVTVAPVGLDTSIIPVVNRSKEEIRKELSLPTDKIVLLFVGRMEEYKRPFEAIKLIDDLRAVAHMVLIGTGTLNQRVQNEIDSRNLMSKVTRIDKIPNTEIHKYYKACDYYVNFNKDEIFGMSILEAMFHGCTVLARYAPGPNCIIEDRISGYLVDDISEMEAIIRRKEVLSSDIIKARIMDSFTWDKTAQIFDKWIKENV